MKGELTDCGLICPKCGTAVNTRLIAKSFPQPGGQLRIRYCDCHNEVTTLETVLPIVGEDYLVIFGLRNSDDIRRVRETVEMMGGQIINRKRYA